jgi:hypothetical protein
VSLIVPEGWTFVGTYPTGYFRAPLTVEPGTYLGYWSVETTDGILSDRGVITFQVLPCDSTNPISIINTTVTLDCKDLAGDVIEIPVEPLVVTSPGTVIDWSTWTTVTPPTPASPSITLGFNFSGVRVMFYTIPTPISSDAFSWTVCTTGGDCATSGVVTVLDCVSQPSAVADSACVSCADSVVIDVLANDDGNGSPLVASSVTITTPPSNGTAIWNGTGVLYTPNPTFSGNDSFEYTVANAAGAVSDPATVTVEVLCAGEGGTITVCDS